MKLLMIVAVAALLSGCGTLGEIVDNGQAIIEGATSSFIDVGMASKVVEAVAAPSVVSITELILAGVAVATGGAAGWVGAKKGAKAVNGKS